MSTPVNADMRGRKLRGSSVSFDLSDDFWETCDMLDCYRDILLFLFCFLSAEILDLSTRSLFFRARYSSSELSRELSEHLDFDPLRLTEPLIFPEAGLTGLRLCVLSLPA